MPDIIAQLARAEAVRIFRIRAIDVSVASTNDIPTPVACFQLPTHNRGYVTAVGHEATREGWAETTWAIATGKSEVVINRGRGRQARGFTNQIGCQWGRIAQPGEVWVPIPDGEAVCLLATQDSGAAINVDGLIVGYFWPKDAPGEPK